MSEHHQTVLALVSERTDPDADRPPSMTRLDLVVRALRRGVPDDEIDRVLTNLVDTDYLVRFTDPDDMTTTRYALATDAQVRRLIKREATRDDPNRDWIGAMNDRLAEVAD